MVKISSRSCSPIHNISIANSLNIYVFFDFHAYMYFYSLVSGEATGMSASQNVKTFVVQLECKETSIPIEMEVDLANPEGAFEILQMQILSVTEIEACEQEIMSVQGNVIASDADLVAVLRTESDPKVRSRRCITTHFC